MNTQPSQISSLSAARPSTTRVAARGGWFTRNWKGLALTSLIVFLVLPLALLGSAFAAPPAAEQAGVIQTQETNEEGVVGELIECRRSEGVLTIKIRFRNNLDKSGESDLYSLGLDRSGYSEVLRHCGKQEILRA